MTRQLASAVVAMAAAFCALQMEVVADEPNNYRTPQNDREWRFWLENMVWHHGFSLEELQAATGATKKTLEAKLTQFKINSTSKPKRPEGLLTLPFPGGRHPRIGFLEGAIRPQRETKVSVFTPWSQHDYVVVDVPEAIWSNLGLTYLAHTHVPTVWTKAGKNLEPLEWARLGKGEYRLERILPNGIRFGTHIKTKKSHVEMEMWLKNGTSKTLTGMRVQNCVMLKSAAGFNQQTNDNKMADGPFAICHSPNKKRWIITAWEPVHRAWYNERCPCLHSDPKFPDCDPGKTVTLRGWLSFYEGEDIKAEIVRIKSEWQPNKQRTTEQPTEKTKSTKRRP